MKKCSWCGKEYPVEETVCAIDGHALESSTPPKSHSHLLDVKNPDRPISAEAKRQMLIGGALCGTGILVTVGTYAAAANSSTGGPYLVAWGAILVGALKFFRGVRLRDHPLDSSRSTAVDPMPDRSTWKCNICGELSERQFSSCWKCTTPRDAEQPRLNSA